MKTSNQLSYFKTTALFIFFILLTTFSFSLETLSNQSIVSLSNAKVSKEIIIEKIKSSPNQFDLSATGVIGLKTSKVSDQIVEAMLLSTKNLPLIVNKDVIDMQQGGVSRDIITKKIQLSKCNFNTDTESMIALKTAKVPDSIQKAMMAAENNSSSTETTAVPQAPLLSDAPTPDIKKFVENGIYYEQRIPSIDYIQLEPTTTNNTKGGTYGEHIVSGMTYGVTGSTNKVGLANKSANMIIKDARPVFYFVFSGGDRKEMNTVREDIFSGVASPNDFVLVKAKVSGKGRQITIGKHTAFTNESGFSEGTYQFRFKKINTQMYKVYFENDLPAGEYAFYYNKGSTQAASLKLYDFSNQNGVIGNEK